VHKGSATEEADSLGNGRLEEASVRRMRQTMRRKDLPEREESGKPSAFSLVYVTCRGFEAVLVCKTQVVAPQSPAQIIRIEHV
jgi:hypothetical protein